MSSSQPALADSSSAVAGACPHSGAARQRLDPYQSGSITACNELSRPVNPAPAPTPRSRATRSSFREALVKRSIPGIVGVAALAATAAAFAAPSTSTRARLVRVTSPVSRGDDATLVALVRPARRCMITVYYKSGPSVAQGLHSKRPRNGRVSWTWMVGTNTTPGRWPIQVSCGSAGSFRTHFRVIG